MPILPWFNRSQVELFTANIMGQIGVPQFFDPSTGRFGTQSQLATALPETREKQTVDPSDFPLQRPTEDPSVYQLRLMLDQLRSMKSFGHDWDSYGSEPPSDLAVAAAQNLVWNIVACSYGVSGTKAIPYSIVPLSGGGVQLEWHGSTDSIEVEVGPSGEFGYLLTRNEARPDRYREEHDGVSEGEILRLVGSAIS
jgi:hypothetical protein